MTDGETERQTDRAGAIERERESTKLVSTFSFFCFRLQMLPFCKSTHLLGNGEADAVCVLCVGYDARVEYVPRVCGLKLLVYETLSY